jgi:phage gpG-like protein
MKSYRTMRVEELKDDIRKKHKLAGMLVERSTKLRTPVGTPATTGKPHYVSKGLQNSITHIASDDNVQIGTNKEYAKYVHNGTRKGFRGRDEWSEAEAAEWFAIYLAQYPGYKGPNAGDGAGMKPRAFLVNGLLKSKQGLKAIYGKRIIGKPPHG